MMLVQQNFIQVINMPRKITGRIGMPKMELKCPSCEKIRLVQYREPSRRNEKCRSCAQFKGGRKPKETKGWTKDTWIEFIKKNGIPNAKKFDGTSSKENHPNWKGGITPENKLERTSSKMIEWRKKVFERDNYTCSICKDKGVELHAHHIKEFSKYPEFRYDIENGMTLCKPCHHGVHFFNKQNSGTAKWYPSY